MKQEPKETNYIEAKCEPNETYEVQGNVLIKSEPCEELTVELTPDQVQHTGKGASPEHETSDHQQAEFFCQICNKNFSRKCGLVSHMLIHEGIKRFQCQV